jgi:hypothetical protein
MTRHKKGKSDKPTSPNDSASQSGQVQPLFEPTQGFRELLESIPENLDDIPDPPPRSVLSLSSLEFRDRSIDAWRNASLLYYLIHSRRAYYDSIIPLLYVDSDRKVIRETPRNIAYECFYDRYIEIALSALKRADAAVPMIRANDLESLMDLFPPFPPIGQVGKWKKELEESSSMVKLPERGRFRSVQPSEPVKAVRQTMPELVRLQEELFRYMQVLRIAPTEAFSSLTAASGDIPSPNLAVQKTGTNPQRRDREELTGTALKLLRALQGLDANNQETAKSRPDITAKARTGNHDSSSNQNAFRQLKDCGLIIARRNVGTWLTEEGRSVLNKLQ